MLSIEEIIKRIIAQRPDMTRESLLQMVKERRESAGALLTDEGAAHMVASDLGASVTDVTHRTTLSVKDLIVGASDVSVSGQVLLAYPSQVFQRREGSQGRVGRFVLQDETGSARVVLWDEKAELLDQQRLVPGVKVRINHGYIRAGLDGRPEINVGRRGSLVIQGSSGGANQGPGTSRKKIAEISEKDLYVSFAGTVVSASHPSDFTRSDGTSGRIARLQVGDETGQVRVVLWNEKADLALDFGEGAVVEVYNGRVRKGLAGDLETHVSTSSDVKRLEEPPKGMGPPKLMVRKIRDLKPGLASVDVLARVAILGQTRVFQRQFGGEGRVGDVTLMDETGSIRLSLWDDNVEILSKLVQGDVILLKGAYTREGLGGATSLNMGRIGSIIVNPELAEAKTLPQYSEGTTPIGELREGFPVNVEGEVTETPSERQITTRDGRELTMVSLRIGDETGEIGVSLWNENAEKARDIEPGTRLRIRHAFVRVGYDGDYELSTRNLTELEVVSEGQSQLGVGGEQGHAKGDQGEARLIELSDSEKSICPSCGGPVRKLDGAYVCDECGRVPEVRRRT